MTKPLTVLKSVGPKLVPFFKTLAIFFVLFGEEAKYGSIFFCIIKCLPVISLILFVLLHGMSLSEHYSYSRRILTGLIFACLGDIFLVWKDMYFEHGILMFAVAQILYASAFGWSPFNPYAGSVLGAIGAVVYYYLQPALDGPMVYLVGMYVVLISTMAWRAIARVQFFDDLWTWTKLCGCAGALLFMTSDLVIAIDKFLFMVPFAHQIVMLTYYAAQFGIALSVVDSQVDSVMKKTKSKINSVM
ncbi:lysoplasmalogenase TMEM86A-like [Liolophura sinensis]|uniref:lysoplasmalogenase TMEM86A-like n=1 Tax=Liolophura sinensis TaxID=3198878 RepID=UPI003158D11F